MVVFKTTNEILVLTRDIVKGLNATIWGGIENAEKVGKIVTTGLTGADIVVGTSHTLKDLAWKDYFCTTMDIIATISTAVGAYLGNHPDPNTKKLTVGARTIRWYCRKYGTFWGCTAALTDGDKKSLHFIVKKK
jgi:hypothetical protein